MIVEIDAKQLVVKNSWSIAPGEEPTGLAFDAKHNRLFSVCSNKLMMVLDASSGKVLSSLPIGEGCDGVEFDADKKCIYTSNGGDGSITVIKQESADVYKVIQTLITKPGAKTLALSNKTHQLFTPAGNFGEKPAATAENPRPKKPVLINSFELLICE
jgi:DNA-binding beta-propeller fold protein YncE